MLKNLLMAFAALTLTTASYAQFGNLLKDLKDLKGAVESIKSGGKQEEQKNDTPQAPGSLSGRSTVTVSPDEYCTRITNNESIRALSDAMNTVGDPRAAVMASSQHTFLDNTNGDLERWVFDQLSKLPSREDLAGLPSRTTQGMKKEVAPQVLSQLAKAVNDCAKKTDVFLVFAKLDNWGKLQDNSITDGTIQLGVRNGRISNGASNPREATLMAFFFEGADEIIKKISPNPTASFNNAAQEIRIRNQQLADAKNEEEKKEKDARKRSEELKAFNASADGQLLRSYQLFQVVQHCHDIRKGFAVQFVSLNEINELKKNMRQIEAKLKAAVNNGDTDRIWGMAEQRNRNYGQVEIDGEKIGGFDIFVVIENNNKSNWTLAKQDCDMQTNSLKEMVREIIGSAPVKRSF